MKTVRCKLDLQYRQSFGQYFWDTDVMGVSDDVFVCRVLEKGSVQDIQSLKKHYGAGNITTILIDRFAHDRPTFSPLLTRLFITWFDIPDDLGNRAMSKAKENDFFARSV